MKSLLSIAIASAIVLATAACNNGSSSPLPTAVTPVTLTTQTFTGTVQVGGSDFNPFTVAQTGEVDITLTSAGPPPTIFMGLGIGTPSGSTCALITNGSTQVQAGTAIQLTGTAVAGTFCVQVYDIGNQTGPITYTVTVAHP